MAIRDFLKKFTSGVKSIPAFAARPFRQQRPDTTVQARTGDQRYTPEMAKFRQGARGTTIQQANRLDDIDWRDLDRVRFYPAVRDSIRAIVSPAARANIHFVCNRPEIAELAQQEIGVWLPSLIRQTLRGALEFGYHAGEIRWIPKFDIICAGGLQEGGNERSERYYPYIWTISKFAHFDPQDCRILIDTRTGDFAGIRQYVLAKNRDVLSYKCFIYTHNKEFDSHYGVAETKPTVPFVDLALSIWDSTGKYSDLFAVPGTFGRFPLGKTNVGGGATIDNASYMQSVLDSLGQGFKVSLPSNVYDQGGQYKWDLGFFQPVSTSEPYTALIDAIDNQIRVVLGVSEMASSQRQGVGGLGDQGAEDKIGLHLQNIETYLDDLKPMLEKIADQFRIFNFGHDAPPLKCYFEPVDMNVTKALLAAVVEILSSGQPIQDANGNLIYPDWGKILQDKGIPVVSVSSRTLVQQLMIAAQARAGGGEGEDDDPTGAKETLAPTPETRLAARKRAISLVLGAIDDVETAAPIRAKLRALLAEVASEVPRPDLLPAGKTESGLPIYECVIRPADIWVDPDIQHKDGIVDEENQTTRSYMDGEVFDPEKAGHVFLWQRLDGRLSVVDGHHRRARALAAGNVPLAAYYVREVDGVDFETARGLGEIQIVSNPAI